MAIKRFSPEDLNGPKKHKISKVELQAKHKFRTPEMEIAVANYFNFRRNLIVPNVSYGMLDYEADMVIVSNAGYATEVEIKVSASDLKKDAKKSHKHRNKIIHKLYFAIPEYLEKYIDDIPSKAGILLVKPIIGRIGFMTSSFVNCVRGPQLNNVPKWDDRKKAQLTRLSTMRIWSLKEKIFLMRRDKNES